MRNGRSGYRLASFHSTPSFSRAENHPFFCRKTTAKIYGFLIKIHEKCAKKSRFPTFWGKLPHFMGFPPFYPLFHRSFTPLKGKMGEIDPLHPRFLTKKGVKLSHFQRSFPQKNRRKPLILRGFRGFSTVCSQVEFSVQTVLNFRCEIGSKKDLFRCQNVQGGCGHPPLRILYEIGVDL